MARQEIPREDLLRDARALVVRGELRVQGFAEHVVIGFRANGAASVYFGEDPALHFTSDNRLRRAFIDNDLYKAVDAQLVRMRRVRTEGEVQLQSRPLTDTEQQELLDQLRTQLTRLEQSLASRAYTLVGQVPSDGDLPARAQGWLNAAAARPITVADNPNAA